MSDFLFRSISVWVVLLGGLFSLVFTVMFGWSVQYTLDGGQRLGVLGKAAVEIAKFPKLANEVIADGMTDMDEHIRVPRTNADLSEYQVVAAKPGINLEGLFVRFDRDSVEQASGWRILVGPFTLDGKVEHAALALGPDLTVEHVWYLHEDAVKDRTPSAVHRKLVHGFDVLRDGSVIFTFDEGVSIQRFDSSSSPVWTTEGLYSHSVTIHDDERYAWSMTARGLVEFETATGSIHRGLSMDDIIRANPMIDLLEIRRSDDNDLAGNRRTTSEPWMHDPFHLNDVDPLPADLADQFPDFNTGDLLVSVRSLNLVFVVDPDTLKVKWWRSGVTRRQHDPDWGKGWESSGSTTTEWVVTTVASLASTRPTFSVDVLYDGRPRRGRLLLTNSR